MELTVEQMDTLLAKYFEPIYKVIGGGVAIVVLILAVFLVLYPFLNRRLR